MRSLLALAAAALLGCASGAPETPAPRERITRPAGGIRLANESVLTADTVAAPLTATLEAVVEAYAALEIPVTEVARGTGRLETREVRLRRIAGRRMSRFLDCGQGITGQRADSYDVTVTLLTSVLPVPEDRSRVVTDLDATARPRDHAGSQVSCTSRGALEALLLEEVRTRLAGQSDDLRNPPSRPASELP